MANEKRLIDANKLNAVLQNIAEHLTENGDALLAAHLILCQEIVDRQRTVDAVEVVHGRWELVDECSNAGVYCSVCHKKVYKESYANQKLKSKYCPNCGSRVDGDFVAY